MEPPTPQQPRRRRFGLPTDARLVVLAACVIFVLPLLAIGVAFAKGVGRSPNGETPARFAVAPDFTLPTFDGQNVTLSNYDDRPVLLFFFASWCVPCQEEAPHIQNAWLEYRDRGYMFIGINVSDTETYARAFIQKYGFTFPVVRDQRGSVFLDY